MAERVAIVGTGLIGGSIGLALRAADPQATVVGYDVHAPTAAAALASGAIATRAGSAADAARGAGLVVIAVPVDRIEQIIGELAPTLAPGAIVTDVGSTKVAAVAAGEAAAGDRFVGGHPMAGSERHGIEGADARLFEGAWWVLTPTETTSSQAYSRASQLASRVGATPVAVDPVTHDSLVARLSHLPQLTASTLVAVAASAGDRDALLGLAAAGFRDVTRIAASHPDLWVSILRSNRHAVLDALSGFRDELGKVSALLERERWDELRAFMSRARAARTELFAKPEFGGEPVALSLLVPDKPGVLAEVTTAAGELGANIEDLRIVHSTEGGRGRLELIVAGEGNAARLRGALEALGYRVERSELAE